ncbi:MAG: DUF1552 domain-containing protein [Synoicihabitans sp.]
MNNASETDLRRHLRAISRRKFLRGVGATLAVPTFASLLPNRMLAATQALELATTPTGAPLRTAFVTFPNGAIPAQWWPTGGQTSFELSESLQSLHGLRDQIQILGGLDHLNANPGKDGAGDHARGNGVFLTGVRLNKSATDIRAGISIDQLMAQHVGHLTRLPSLELTCDERRTSKVCDSGYSCAYQYNISWKDASTPMTPERDPRLVFERLFGAGEHGTRSANAAQRMADRRSVLDFVMSDARRLNRQLGHEDQEKLDQYLTGVRDVESRIQRAEQFGPTPDPDVPTPEGIPESRAEYVRIMYDLMLLAFKTDSTRVATFVLAHDGDNRSFSEIGINEGHHDLSHHQNREDRVAKVASIDKWYVEQFSAFLQRLDETEDIDGNSLLHNSRIVYGSGNADGNRHTHENLPVILAGGGGGTLYTGRYVDHQSKPMSNLFLTLADQMGVEGVERFGDSTGRLSNV